MYPIMAAIKRLAGPQSRLNLHGCTFLWSGEQAIEILFVNNVSHNRVKIYLYNLMILNFTRIFYK